MEEEKVQRTKTELEQIYWREMTFEGTFVLLMSVDAYLTHDYEYCLRISMTDFSYVANSCIFESNILRVRALASIKHFEDELVNVNLKNQEWDPTFFQYLTSAIACIENAYEIFEAKD